MIRTSLKDYFLEIEAKREPLSEFNIGDKIREILNIQNEKLTDKEEIAELAAFQFMADYHNKDTGWGTYHGPMMVFKNKQGQFVEFPSIQQIDLETLNYWRKRAEDSTHPILVFRYANLVYDFEPIILKKGIDFTLAQKVIDSAIQSCAEGFDDALGCRSKLSRALSLAVQINDSSRITKLKDCILATEQKFAEDDKPGLWGYAFQWLLLDKTGKITLSEEEKNKLITDIESRLERLKIAEDPDPWRIEHAVELLAQYYASKKDEENLKRVLSELETAFRKNKHSNSDGMLVSNYLEKLIETYLEYSSFPFAKEARERIVTEMGSLGDRAKFAMHEISTEIKITKEEIDTFLAAIFGENNEFSLEKVIARVASNFILRKKAVKNQLDNLAKNHPISYIVGHTIASEEGFPIVKFGSIDEDYDKHMLENSSRNLHFQTPFIKMAFDEIRKRFTPETLAETLMLSAALRAEDKDYILKILKSYWSSDYLAASCLTMPLIEDAVRTLYRINNQTYIKPNDEGGFDVMSLDRLLERGLIKAIFRTLGDDVEYYLRVLLTERVGWNLRNNFAHGINKHFFGSEDVASRLLHVLMILSLVRKAEQKPE